MGKMPTPSGRRFKPLNQSAAIAAFGMRSGRALRKYKLPVLGLQERAVQRPVTTLCRLLVTARLKECREILKFLHLPAFGRPLADRASASLVFASVHHRPKGAYKSQQIRDFTGAAVRSHPL